MIKDSTFRLVCPRCGAHLFNCTDVQIHLIRCFKCRTEFSIRIEGNRINILCLEPVYKT